MAKQQTFKHLRLTAISITAVALILISGSGHASSPDFKLDLRMSARLDLAGAGNAEIISVNGTSGVVAVSNSRRKSIDFYMLRASGNAFLEPVSIWAAGNGVPTIFEPTSVAIHPQLPIAFATVTGKEKNSPGRLVGFDLRDGSMGVTIISQNTGIGPDSVAVSPNGRWLMIACEAEEDDQTPGSIQYADLRSLNTDGCPADNRLELHTLPGLEQYAGAPLGKCEPEFVTFDPLSRFALVTCQENDCVVVVDLQHDTPAIVSSIQLMDGSEPDGIAVLPFVMGPVGSRGCLIGIAEEGRKGRSGRYSGNSLSLYWLDPEKPGSQPALMSRTDIRPWVNPLEGDRRLDPENVILGYYSGKPYAILGVERGDCLICLDIQDPMRPEVTGRIAVGSRPEGLAQCWCRGKLFILAACEGDDSDGTISVLELTGKPLLRIE